MIRGFNLQSFLSFLLVFVNVVVDLVIVNHCDPICGCLVLLTYANMSWFDEMLLSFLITWQCPCRHGLCSEGSMTIGRTIAMSQRHPKSCFSIGESALRQPYSGTYGWNWDLIIHPDVDLKTRPCQGWWAESVLSRVGLPTQICFSLLWENEQKADIQQ